MSSRKRQSLLNGAFVLVLSTVLVKIIGALYKIPLTGIIGATGRGYFSTAYNIYTPLYAISMAGLPIAVSRMVSENTALGKYKDVRKVFKVALKAFLVTGTVGTLVMLALSYPYAQYIAKTPLALPSILAIAPSIFFCCVMSAYRGYYEGLSNMYPTGISQVIEALGKLVLGLGLAYAIREYGIYQYQSTGIVYGVRAASEAEMYSAISPYAAAGTIVGVTVGTFLSVIYLMIRRKRKGDGFTAEELALAPKPQTDKQIMKLLISIAIPVVIGSLISNLTNLIDAATVQNRLSLAVEKGKSVIMSQYPNSVTTAMPTSEISTYLYGCYNSALDFKNLVPTVTQALGISAIPILAGAWAVRDKRKSKITVESVIRVTMLIALPAGFGMAVLSEPILTLFYGTSQPDLIPVAAPVLTSYGFAVALIAVSSPITNMLQAVGRADVPVVSLLLGGIVKLVANYVLVGIPSINIQGAPYGSILCYIVIVGYNIFFLCKEIGIFPNLISVLIKPLLAAGMSAASAWASYGLIVRSLNGMFATVAAIAIAGFIYVIALFLFRAISKDDILMLPKGKNLAKVLEKYHLIG